MYFLLFSAPKHSKFGVLPQISTFAVPKLAEKSNISKSPHVLYIPPYNLALISTPAFQVLPVLGVGVNGGKCGQVSGFKWVHFLGGGFIISIHKNIKKIKFLNFSRFAPLQKPKWLFFQRFWAILSDFIKYLETNAN